MLTCWVYLLLTLSLLIGCGKSESAKGSVLRVSTEGDPQTLDPRRVRDLATTTTIHMLYEGLMRNGADGNPAPALAESVTISPDQTTYTFTLRKSGWSDGTQVTANDIAETWKSILSPQFPSPNAYQLYPIRGAQAAKEGKISVEEVGVRALDESTLIVELEQATPYFLSLLATHFYYPVHQTLRDQSPDKEIKVVTNGPFKLTNWHKHNELTASPNPHYWDRSNVHLDQISLIVLDNPTALQIYQGGGLEWTGSPLSTISIDALQSLKQSSDLEITPAAGLFLMRINTEKTPFTSVKLRKAFAFALNRTDLVEHVLQGNQIPAYGMVPPTLYENKPHFDENVAKARWFFDEALKELNITREDLPEIAIYYATGERGNKIAQVAQQQWKEAFGIQVALKSNEAKVYFDQLKKRDYQIGIGSWYADYRDPISFLEIFKLKNNGTNNTEWEHPDFIAFLDKSGRAHNAQERNWHLKEAEKVIMDEMPVIPLFFASYNYLKNPSVKGVYFSELGYIDFKNAYIER